MRSEKPTAVARCNKYGIVPKTIIKGIRDVIEIGAKDDSDKVKGGKKREKKLSKKDKEALIEQYTSEMKRAAKQLDFERAAILRDKIKLLRDEIDNK